MMDRLRYYILFWCVIFPFAQVFGQSGEGGGVYLEDGATLSGSVVFGNYSLEGYGVAGGNAILLNCSVGANKVERNPGKGIKPGDVLCADGKVVDVGVYASRAEKDAIGVVFWVNSDVYGKKHRTYVAALQEAEKAWGENGLVGEGYLLPEQDTACYTMTKRMVERGGSAWEAAVYCADYQAGGQPEGLKWAFPAGYQMSMLYTNMLVVNRTLEALKASNPDVMLLASDWYWSSTRGEGLDHCAWRISLNQSAKEQGIFLLDDSFRDLPRRVRPVLVYEDI